MNLTIAGAHPRNTAARPLATAEFHSPRLAPALPQGLTIAELRRLVAAMVD